MTHRRLVLAGAGLLLVVAQPALAHAFLKSAVPAVGSTVHAPPGEITLRFSEDVEPSFSTVVLEDGAGARIETQPVQQVGADSLVVRPKPLAPGTYKVTWHATSTDTHKTQGSYRFTVAP